MNAQAWLSSLWNGPSYGSYGSNRRSHCARQMQRRGGEQEARAASRAYEVRQILQPPEFGQRDTQLEKAMLVQGKGRPLAECFLCRHTFNSVVVGADRRNTGIGN